MKDVESIKFDRVLSSKSATSARSTPRQASAVCDRPGDNYGGIDLDLLYDKAESLHGIEKAINRLVAQRSDDVKSFRDKMDEMDIKASVG